MKASIRGKGTRANGVNEARVTIDKRTTASATVLSRQLGGEFVRVPRLRKPEMVDTPLMFLPSKNGFCAD